MNKNKLTNILISIFQKESMWLHIFSLILDGFNEKQNDYFMKYLSYVNGTFSYSLLNTY